MRDVTLYEAPDGSLVTLQQYRGIDGARARPAVVGITVAEIEQLRTGQFAISQRDEARERLAEMEKMYRELVLTLDEEDQEARQAEDARDRYREALDEALALAGDALRAHTRAIWTIEGVATYPKDERAATGARLAAELARLRDLYPARAGGDDD